MILISHRGNINGKNELCENNPSYIDSALKKNYDVEIDLWFENNTWVLGHDMPQYKIPYTWLNDRKKLLWVHCKNTEAIVALKNKDIHYFWHETDTVALTSKHYIWAFPGKQPIKNSIAVMPEIYNEGVDQCIGVCSDYINKYSHNVRYR